MTARTARTAVWFDLDGTLVAAPEYGAVLARACDAAGVDDIDGFRAAYHDAFFDHFGDLAADPYRRAATDALAAIGADGDADSDAVANAAAAPTADADADGDGESAVGTFVRRCAPLRSTRPRRRPRFASRWRRSPPPRGSPSASVRTAFQTGSERSSTPRGSQNTSRRRSSATKSAPTNPTRLRSNALRR